VPAGLPTRPEVAVHLDPRTCHNPTMRSIRSAHLLLLCTTLTPVCSATDTQWWAQGDPSAEEQSALEWINRARADPVGTLNQLIASSAADPVVAASIASLLPETPGQLLANLQLAYSVAAANSAAFPHSAAISQAPLALYPAFTQQAALLNLPGQVPAPTYPPGRSPPAYYPPVPTAETLLAGPQQTFSGPNATGGVALFGPYGANYSELTLANLYDPALDPSEWILAWLSAPGTGSPPPGFLSQGDSLPNLTLGHTRMAGISLAPSPASSGGSTLAFFRASQEFFTASDLPYGTTGTVFITGVAYRDQNANGQYDAGEGLAGVTLTLDRTNWGAVTATAGGYAIPVPANSGSYTVTATGGPFAGVSAVVTVETDSIKLDWPLPALAATLPPQVPVIGATGDCRLVNLSTRGLIEAGASALVGGFVVSGSSAGRETLLIRGIGPSLSAAGIPAAECVPSTSLQLFSGPSVIASNSGWTTATDSGAAASQAATETGAFPLTNWAGGGGDSAVVTTLAPGAYSVVVTPAPGTPPAYVTGHIGLVEIYEVAATGGAQLTNLSSRGAMGANDAQLVIGATLGGGGQARLLIRAAGPALAQNFGLSPVLSDPVLTLYDHSGATLAGNDDWSDSAQTDQIRSLGRSIGAFPFPEGSADSALIILLSSGPYSARLGAKIGTAPSGLALVEIYSAP